MWYPQQEQGTNQRFLNIRYSFEKSLLNCIPSNIPKNVSKIIPELEWSSLFYDEERVDELWKIKYSENFEKSSETIQEIIETVGKCNISENVWSNLLEKIGTKYGLKLLWEVVSSQSFTAPNATELFLQRFHKSKSNIDARIHLLVASNEGDWAAEIMQILLNHGVQCNSAVSTTGMTPLHHASQNESSSGPKLVKLLLENGAKPNTRSTGYEKSTPVHLAASNQGDYADQILKLLLDNGGKCDTRVGLFEPIHFATMNNGKAAPKLLDLIIRKRGINVIHKDSGMSIVHFTMFNNGDCGTMVAKKLLENRAEPNSCDNRKQTPLHLAARDTIGENNQIAIMEAFLKNGGDPNAVDKLGRTPVHYAAANEGEYAYKKLELLLAYGGKIAVRDKGGLTPVHYTVLNKGLSGSKMRNIVEYKKYTNNPLNTSGETLLHRLVNGNDNKIYFVQTTIQNGENPNAKDSLGCSPVHVAVAEIESSVGLEILEILVTQGGNPNLPDDENQHTPLHYAASSLKEWAPKQMKILLSNGGNVDAISKEGYTPLHLAAMNSGINGPELTSILLEHGANPNFVDFIESTPVHVAILNENDERAQEIISRLLENGGNANARDKKGRTPLHYAIVEKPNSKIIHLLIKYRGNIMERDNNGMTPNRLRMMTIRK